MKGDFSRQTFRPDQHYDAVLLQQGRVQLDADWNESQAIARHRAEAALRDVVGSSGAPTTDPGFEIRVGEDGTSVVIGAGRYYVDGILCENEAEVTETAQPDAPGSQPFAEVLKASDRTTGIVYLDVWKRHVTALDDPAIRETALGGPDTTTRTKVVWQVKVLPVKASASGIVGADSLFDEWTALLAAPSGTLSARARPVPSTEGPCIIPPQAGYRGLENQLYRVEIHQGGTLGTPTQQPTFKWSRDNGTVVTAVERLSGQEVTVRDLGPDEVLGFSSGQWVELLDDRTELNGTPGTLVQIEQVNRATRVLKLASAPGVTLDPKAHPKLRRWDSVGAIPVTVPATNEGFVGLEQGLEIKFAPGTFTSGDYWLIPARTAINGDTGTIDWPFSTPQAPQGVVHHYCRLAILQRNPQGNQLSLVDGRKLFPPLTGVGALHVVGTSWLHDDVVTIQDVQSTGFQIVLDGIPSQPSREAPSAPQSVNPGSMIVTLETPMVASTDPSASPPVVETILGGTLTVSDNSLVWKPDLASFLKLMEGPPTLRMIRITLKGHMIWSVQAGQLWYLDGQAFAKPGLRSDGETPRTDLLLPSGSGARASDFVSWLYVPADIAPPPPELADVAVVPPVVRAGESVRIAVTLDRPAPEGGTTIALTKTVLSGADPIPSLSAITVPAGQSRAEVSLATRANVAASLSVKATLRQVEMTDTLTVQVVQISISPSAQTILVNAKVQLTATISGAGRTDAVFAVKEGAAGGSLAKTGGATASYTAPARAGVFHVIATSVADSSKQATATITVKAKSKDTKERKELVKDQVEQPKILNENIVIKRLEVNPKTRETKIREVIVPRGLSPTDETAEKASKKTGGRSAKSAKAAKAFITSDERPAVGEPKRPATKRRKQARTGKPKPSSGR